MRNASKLLGIGLIILSGLAGCSLHKWAPLNKGTAGSGGADESGGASGSGGSGGDDGSSGNTSHAGATAAGGTTGTATGTTVDGCATYELLVEGVCTPLVSGIEVDGGTLSATFAPTTTTYATTVNAAATTVTVTSAVPGVTVTINDQALSALAVDLTTAFTSVTIVASSAGVTATYQLVITRYGAQQAYVKASNTGAGDRFGYSVTISADGSTLAVGAVVEDGAGYGVVAGDDIANGLASSGAVYVFVQSDGTWSQQACLKASNAETYDHVGESVSLSADGNVLAFGAPDEDSDAAVSGTNPGPNDDNENGFGSGAAYVFSRNAGVWAQEVMLKASNAENGDTFGRDVALSSDGKTLIVAATLEDSSASAHGTNPSASTDDESVANSGAAYAFTKTDLGWVQQAMLKPSNAESEDRFGGSRTLAVSPDGKVVAFGSFYEDSDTSVSTTVSGVLPTADSDNANATDSGAVQIFRLVGVTWLQDALLKASNADAGDQFGIAVSLSSDGSRLAVGAYLEDSAASASGTNPDAATDDGTTTADSGAVYLFAYNGAAWAQQTMLKASNAEPSDQFGYNVALSPDGNALVVSALLEDSAPSVSGTNPLGDGDYANATSATADSGSAYLFSFDGSTWTQQACLKAQNSGASDAFGREVGIGEDRVVVGAEYEDSAASGIDGDGSNNSLADAGAAYVFVY